MTQSVNKSVTLRSSNGYNDDRDDKKKASRHAQPSSPLTALSAAVVLAISVFTMPHPLQPPHGSEPTVQHVWYYGWVTALSTGLGVVPLVFARQLDAYWVGISNAIAAGMMIAACYSLFIEGCTYEEPHDLSEIPAEYRTTLGAILGLGFILGTKQFLDKYEDLKVGGLGGADARRAMLIFFVMTLHSFSEGVGIGVSFGGKHGSELGVFISASLAVHNVPEGLAIAVVLVPKGTPMLTAALWAILTSVPQPLMAVPSYLFVHHFISILPVGLGFAGGAMAWVAFFELLLEAYEDTGVITTGIISACSLASMLVLQGAIDESSRS